MIYRFINRFVYLLTIVLAIFIHGNIIANNTVNYFALQDVTLLNGPFLQAQNVDKNYLLSLDADRLLAPYLREAGLQQKAESYTNWENTGLDGHIGGHYLSALSMMYASTNCLEIKERLDYVLDQLEMAQRGVGTGFLGGTPSSIELWDSIKNGNIKAGYFDLNGRWVPLYNIHKIYAGLRDAYIYYGSEKAKLMLIKLTDWMIDITSNLSDEQIQIMLQSEHGGLNEVFADVYEMCGDDKYLELAKRFSHLSIIEPLISETDNLSGLHANTQIPKVIGYKRIAELNGDESWNRAAYYFWDRVVNHRSVSIGGNSVREHFLNENNQADMLNDSQGPETCNTYNMLRLTKMLYADSARSSYADFYERALFNHILSSQEPSKGGFVYFTPMRPGHYRVYSQVETSMWCCVGSGLENHAKYGEFIYANDGDNLYVNLFIASHLRWKDRGVGIRQITNFPDSDEITLHIDESPREKFAIKIRKPHWLDESKELSVTVNGKETKYTISDNGGYIEITKLWRKGDVVRVSLPMGFYLETSAADSRYHSFIYGPIVLAAKMGDKSLDGLYADDSRGGHIAHGELMPLQSVPMLVGEKGDLCKNFIRVDDNSLKFEYTGDLFPADVKSLIVEPFFRIHNARYAIYMQSVEPSKAKEIYAQQKEVEQRYLNMQARIVDMVYAGEQQPESDHAILSKDSESGLIDGRRYRNATGWFSYLFNIDSEASTIVVTMQEGDKIKNLKIDIDGSILDVVPEVCNQDDKGVITLTYKLKKSLAKGGRRVRFSPLHGGATPSIYEIKIIK